MNSSMIRPLPAHGSSQPLISLYTGHYRESIGGHCPLLFYEFYGTEELITCVPTGCLDFLVQEKTMSGALLHPSASFEAVSCIPESRYFGIRFPTGMLPSRHFPSDYFISRLLKLSTFEERVSWFTQSLQPEQMMMSVSEPVRYMLEQICLSNGTVSIHELAATLSYSERHIHRLFLAHMGYSPKLYSRIIRFQSAMTEMMASPERNNSDFIKHLGYSDQAHFQREFKEFTGLTPRQFINLFLTTTLRI